MHSPHPSTQQLVFISNSISEIMMVRSLLESYEIESYTRDELSVQTNPLCANAIGGIKLYVSKSRADDAIAALKEHNYTPEEPEPEGEALPWMIKLNTTTQRIPFIGNMNFLPRIFVLGGLCIVLICVALFYLFKPGLADQLKSHEWCIEYVTYNGEVYDVNTITMRNNAFGVFMGVCTSHLDFTDQFKLIMKNGSGEQEIGNWKEENSKLVIYNCSEKSRMFEGVYTIQKNGRDWTLSSQTTKLIIWYNDKSGFYD